MSVWELKGVTKRFRRGLLKRVEHTAVNNVSLKVNVGDRIGVMGESGAGKTTLAQVGLGLIPLDGGTISLFGEPTIRWSSRRWRQARSRAQLLFQDPRAMLNPYLPIGLVLEESAILHRPGRNPHRQVQRVLRAVSLDDRGSAYPHQLSGGELRRAGLARLLLTRPDLVVVDEPAAGLDAALKADLLELLFNHVGDECAIVVISHDVSLVSWACASVLVMHLGEIVDGYDTETLYRESATRHPYTLTLLRAAGYTFDITEVGPEP